MGLNLSKGGIGLDLGAGTTSSGGLYSLGGGGGADFLSDIGGFASGGGYASDNRFVSKMNQGIGASSGGGFQSILDAATFGVQYGFQRAIDSRYGPPSVDQTGMPATYAGQNGQTYEVGRGGGNGGGINLLPLLLIGGAVYFLASAK